MTEINNNDFSKYLFNRQVANEGATENLMDDILGARKEKFDDILGGFLEQQQSGLKPSDTQQFNLFDF